MNLIKNEIVVVVWDLSNERSEDIDVGFFISECPEKNLAMVRSCKTDFIWVVPKERIVSLHSEAGSRLVANRVYQRLTGGVPHG